jgi:hypothetical protein
MPGLVPGIQPTEYRASGEIDSGDKRQNETVQFSGAQLVAAACGFGGGERGDVKAGRAARWHAE